MLTILRYGVGAALAWQGLAWGMWGLWSQIILTLVRRFPLSAGRFRRWFAVHILARIAICTLTMLAVGALDWFFAQGEAASSYFMAVCTVVLNRLDLQVVLYWAVVGAAYMVEFVRRYRERECAALELQQQLARTQLKGLRMQLNLHYPFNALNSVTELMEVDVREAQRTLTRVSEMLPLSLRSAASTTIPLWREIELVELYLQNARIRFGNGLAVAIEVDPTAVDLQVPSFVLQPLVEDALKRAFIPDRAGQSSDVTARRVGTSLELVV